MPLPARRLRVLQFITELNPGGAERIVCDLANGLDDCEVAVAALDGRGVFAARLRELGHTVYDLGGYHAWQIGVIGRLRKILRAWRPDILHTHLFHANIIGRLSAAGLGIPVISTCHIREKRVRPWHFWLDRLTARLAFAEVCVAPATARFQQTRTGIAADFFPVINNGVDTGEFFPLPDAAARRRLREQFLPAADNKLWCGFLGRLEAQKGVDILLRAWRLLPDGLREKAVLLIGGAGREETALRAQAQKTPNVIFCGYQSRPADFLRTLDLCVMPSRYEGFGLVAVEAMACGIAVAASAEVADIFRDANDGWSFPADNPAALAATINSALTDSARRENIARSGVLRARDFSREKMLSGYREIFRRAAGK